MFFNSIKYGNRTTMKIELTARKHCGTDISNSAHYSIFKRFDKLKCDLINEMAALFYVTMSVCGVYYTTISGYHSCFCSLFHYSNRPHSILSKLKFFNQTTRLSGTFHPIFVFNRTGCSDCFKALYLTIRCGIFSLHS